MIGRLGVFVPGVVEQPGWRDNLKTYLQYYRSDVIHDFWGHALIVAVSIVLATLVGVGLGVATYRTRRPRELVLAVTGTILTLPSLAMFGVFISLPGLGLGARSVVVALVLYGLLPIVRNTVVGLRAVDPAVVESAQGMGMGARSRLLRIELPLAWPVIITGVRVATLMLVGIAAIGAYINGPGLGNEIFDGLSSIGSALSIPEVLVGTAGVIVLAFLFDLVFVVINRLTVPRGIR